MIRKYFYFAIPVLLLLIGCAKRDLVWVGGNPNDFDRDNYECELRADSITDGYKAKIDDGLALKITDALRAI